MSCADPFILPQPGAVMVELVNIYEAKTQLSRLVDRAAAGEDIVIGRAGKPLVRLVPVDESAPRQPGLLKGVTIPNALFDPLPDEELDEWD
jgi:prevent-host-death family protein